MRQRHPSTEALQIALSLLALLLVLLFARDAHSARGTQSAETPTTVFETLPSAQFNTSVGPTGALLVETLGPQGLDVGGLASLLVLPYNPSTFAGGTPPGTLAGRGSIAMDTVDGSLWVKTDLGKSLNWSPINTSGNFSCPAGTFMNTFIAPNGYTCANASFSNILGTVSAAQMLALPSGDVYVGNGSGQPQAQALSGDITMNSSGVTTLKNTGAGAGSCTNCNVSVDAQGRVTAYANGASGGSGGGSVVAGGAAQNVLVKAGSYWVNGTTDTVIVGTGSLEWFHVPECSTLGVGATWSFTNDSVTGTVVVSLGGSDVFESWMQSPATSAVVLSEPLAIEVSCPTAGGTTLYVK